jgi:hypothetical protein
MAVLRRIFGPKREQVTGSCRKLHDKEFLLFTKYILDDQMKTD